MTTNGSAPAAPKLSMGLWMATALVVGALIVAPAVIDGPQSAVWQQATNRLPTEQAVLYGLTAGDWKV